MSTLSTPITMGFCSTISSIRVLCSIPLFLSVCLPSAVALIPTVDSFGGRGPRLLSTFRSRDGFDGIGSYSYHGKIKSSLHENQLQDISSSNEVQNDNRPFSSCRGVTERRNFLVVLSTTATISTLSSQSAVNAIDNPLNLKGTFWETGQLYQKSNTPPLDDDDDFFSILENTVEALHSPQLLEAITEGKYGQASRLLRGGLVSESRIRIAANALIDSIPEENDEGIYKSNESFRVFLRYLDVLDAEVEAASRPLGVGGEDPRLKILTRLGEVEDALKVFLKNVRGGLGE